MDEPSDVGAEAKKIHPFFSAPKSTDSASFLPSSTRPVTPDSSCSPASEKATKQPIVTTATDIDDSDPTQGRNKRRKTDSAADVKQPAKRGRPKGNGKGRLLVGNNITNHFGQQDDGALGDAGSTTGPPEAVQKDAAKVELRLVAMEPTLARAPLPNPTYAQIPNESNDQQTQESKPKKILKFNPKTGTIGSPPKPKVETIDELVSKPKSVGRPKKNKKATCLVVRIHYGFDEASRTRIGDQIEGIYSGIPFTSTRNTSSTGTQSTAQQISPPASSQETPKKHAPRKGNTPQKAKTAHPFFTSKSKPASAAPTDAKERAKSPVKRQSIFTSTPCSPKRVRQQPAKFNFPQFGMKSGGFKFPGAQLAAWPGKGMVHVRGDDRDLEPSKHHQKFSSINRNARKAKGRQIELTKEESVMYRVHGQLRLDNLAEELIALNAEDFLPTPSTLRVPGRHFESGKKLQTRVLPELRTLMLGNQAKSHPAIVDYFRSLEDTLPAFDRSTCESTAWTQKYSPTKASQVLQSGNEAELLRDWLQTLKVQSVDTGTSDSNNVNPRPVLVKKKKRKKLDDFVVSSDEEGGVMDEVAEDDSSWLPSGSQGSSKRTVVRSGSSKDTRFTNAVLLSGPHGCGKTATVYAIAKELDFEVFEISPGARRNGKDIIEKIGDMTRNHQVSHKQENPKPDDAIDEDDVARDIKSGKQGMMTAFFRPKDDIKLKTMKEGPAQEPTILAAEKPTQKLSRKTQKQSLILLEEVDILYEEDKQFWTTVISLMAQSKRPFIMTCNNENLVPIQSLNLHGIFRFSAAPKELAVDHLLLIAANEGHALRRQAVESLFESRSYDLRASIAELNYWCQIGVADPRGGFGWFYPKWPRGSDLDELGDRIRVVSSDTYQEGMGWLGRDAVSTSGTSDLEEQVARQAWENWLLDTYDSPISASEQEEAEFSRFSQASRQDRLAALDAADLFYNSLSVADVASNGAFSSSERITLDATLPSLPNKAKEDFIIGFQLLDAPLQSRYDTAPFDIATSIRTLARKQLSCPQLSTLRKRGLPNEDSATRKLQHSFSHPSPSEPAVTRYDYSLAFDPIAASEKSLAQCSSHLDPSIFDRTMKMIALDVAPYVRGIVAYDQQLQVERLLRSNLLSEGGKPKKRMRSTRSAYSALEGGSRASTRREKYFSAELNPHLVLRTGGKDWDKAVYSQQPRSGEQKSPPSSVGSVDEMGISID